MQRGHDPPRGSAATGVAWLGDLQYLGQPLLRGAMARNPWPRKGLSESPASRIACIALMPRSFPPLPGGPGYPGMPTVPEAPDRPARQDAAGIPAPK